MVAGSDACGVAGTGGVTLGEARPEESTEIVALFGAVFGESEGPEEGRVIAGLAQDMMAMTPAEEIVVHVSRDGEGLTGCIMFSRLRTADASREVFILSPVAVATAVQGRGIGQALLRHGIDAMQARGVDIVVTYGDPVYYARVGFWPVDSRTIPPPRPLTQPEGWLARPLTGRRLDPVPGPTACVAALDRVEYW